MTTAPVSRLVCSACGGAPEPSEPHPFRCPNANGDDVDHVLVRLLDLDRVAFPTASGMPFEAYRELLHSYHRGRAAGMSDGEFVDLVRSLDDAVAGVAGTSFRATPFARSAVLSDRLGFSGRGGVWVKDETGNVSGSHKGRHLMGLLLHLQVAERLGLADPHTRPDLAIASCGNAALAAAVLARAADLRLRVFVPQEAEGTVLATLRDLGSQVVTCPREPGVAGDPTVARLRAEVAAGAIPFTCQGSENGLAIEGGATLGHEIVSDLHRSHAALDHVVIQVGGGALASSCAQAFDEAVALGAVSRAPAIHTVQTAAGHPLERAYRRVRQGLPEAPGRADIDAALADAARHRSDYMWPWEQEPRSIATGILDDETYDWRAVVAAMLAGGGRALVAGEDALARAHELGHAAGFSVDPTGSAGLAGLFDLLSQHAVAADDRVALLFTGVDR